MSYTRCCCKVPGAGICPYCNRELRKFMELRSRQHGYEISAAVRGLQVVGHTTPPDPQRRATSQLVVTASSNPYSWMSPTMQEFYKRQDRLHKLDKELAIVDPDSTFGRKLKIERELAEIKLEREREAGRIAKAELHERWARKDPYAAWPLWRDPETFGKPATEKQPTRDPWATRRLV